MAVRHLAVLGVLLAAAGLFIFAYPRFRPRAAADSIASSSAWPPSYGEIRARVGDSGRGEFDDSRHNLFAAMFQDRYRQHRHQAYGVKFDGPREIRLMGDAQIPRWEMARVALELHREATEVFHSPFDVDVYETYISVPARKLAELRGDHRRACDVVRFDTAFSAELSPPLRGLYNPLPQNLQPVYYFSRFDWFPPRQRMVLLPSKRMIPDTLLPTRRVQ